MARLNNHHNTPPVLEAAHQWITTCLVNDGSLFEDGTCLWNQAGITEVDEAFVKHPDFGTDDFMTKLRRQVASCSPSAKKLVAEMIWGLLLFPSNMKSQTKRRQIVDLWSLSGGILSENHPMLSDEVLAGIGSGGPGFNNYRPDELEFLVTLVGNLKRLSITERAVLQDYSQFVNWIETVPMQGNRQFRHMLRYFAFPDLVERISSNNDRVRILNGFGVAAKRGSAESSDSELDKSLLSLRKSLEKEHPDIIIDFYESPWKERWTGDRTVKTPTGEVSVAIPIDDDPDELNVPVRQLEARESLQIQAKLARIGAVMGFKVWIAKADQARVAELLKPSEKIAFVEDLPLSYDGTTIDTIKLIDVIWLRGRSIARAFEVEHTTAVYSGLLRMADLLALQPNMDIRLHIVAPDERREKVFREMKRPVFSLLDRGPLSRSCTFISYDSVTSISALEYLAHTNDSIIGEYEESAD